jgi:hypothetical protein
VFTVLTRRIAPIDPPLRERFIANAKRLCIIFAVAAVALTTLDLINVRSPADVALRLRAGGAKLATLPALIDVAFAEPTPEAVIVPIPGADVTLALHAPPMPASTLPEPPPTPLLAHAPDDVHAFADVPAAARAEKQVTELAVARHEDAVEVAMSAPPAMPPMPPLPPPPVRPMPAPAPFAAAPQPAEKTPVKLASLDGDYPPPALITQPAPASLSPSTLALAAAPSSAPIDEPSVKLPATIAVLPPRAPGLPPPSPAQRLHLEGAARAKAERCLANAIYFEARDQPFRGQVAVAQVVMNRVFSPFYPKDICGVIYQNASHHLACQFTFACDGKRKVIDERVAWSRARRIARDTLDGKLYVPAVGTATHYHAVYVHPVWVREMRRVVREGIHTFYRPLAWGNGSDEPVWSRAARGKTASLVTASAAVKRSQ